MTKIKKELKPFSINYNCHGSAQFYYDPDHTSFSLE